MSTALPPVIAEHIAAINASDLDAAAATFADDAYVTTQAEAHGIEAVRALLTKEFMDDHVTLDVREVIDHHGDFIVRTKYDGTYDKTNLPDPLIMTNYFSSSRRQDRHPCRDLHPAHRHSQVGGVAMNAQVAARTSRPPYDVIEARRNDRAQQVTFSVPAAGHERDSRRHRPIAR